MKVLISVKALNMEAPTLSNIFMIFFSLKKELSLFSSSSSTSLYEQIIANDLGTDLFYHHNKYIII